MPNIASEGKITEWISSYARNDNNFELGVFAPLREIIRFRILVGFFFANHERFVINIGEKELAKE